MSDRVHVCSAEDLGAGECELVDVDGREVGVIRFDGEYFALLNTCPHRGGPVCEGKTTNALTGEWDGPGERVTERLDGDPAIACPWHGWEFDLRTGTHLGDDSYAVPTFPVEVDDGELYVATGGE